MSEAPLFRSKDIIKAVGRVLVESEDAIGLG
jgi:hypothetical protein